MAFHITQCPCCTSTFSINTQLLNEADGKVRCGACLSVFLAEQQLVDSESEKGSSEADSSVFVGHAPEDYFDPASFFTRKALQQQQANNTTPNSELGVASKTHAGLRSTSALAPSQATAGRESLEDIAPETGLEERRAGEIKASGTVADTTSPNQQSSRIEAEYVQPAIAERGTALAALDSFKLALEVSEAQRDELLTNGYVPGGAEYGIALTPANPVLDERSAQAPLKSEKLLRVDATATSFTDAATEQNANAQNSSGAIRARALRMEFKDDETLEQLATENLATLQRFAAPVRLRSDSHTRWGRTLALLLAAGLLGMSLAGQHLWRNQENFSQQVRWRPLLEWVCANRGCGLPLYEDLMAIESSNLSVRSHPSRADAVMVQVQMRNTAPFEQAFPVMILSFDTVNNEPIALREFLPTEYLQSELPESATMPVMAPVQINLALMDPGEDAVNYTLAFRRP
ncbi:MAG TPA: hypothetical protein DEF79_08740 [Gammaproteobacteria bacterium]|nr:hypothetical protein [Gammaproteobacteria bacterium]